MGECFTSAGNSIFLDRIDKLKARLTVTPAMAERAAKAVCAHEHGEFRWDILHENAKVRAIERARIALEAGLGAD